jgi:hypothetical protein
MIEGIAIDAPNNPRVLADFSKSEMINQPIPSWTT